MAKNPGTIDPGHGRRLGRRHRRADQRHHRHRRVLASDQDQRDRQAQGALRHDRLRVSDRARRPVGLSQHRQPGEGAHARADPRHLHRQDHELEAGRRQGRADHSLFARELVRHLHLLQGQRAHGQGFLAARADAAGHGGGRQRRGQGSERHRLRRRRVREGHQVRGGEEGRQEPGASCRRSRPCAAASIRSAAISISTRA